MQIIGLNPDGSMGYWGAGVVRQQNPSDFNFPALQGNTVFALQGFDSAGHSLAGVGASQLDANGNITGGEEDINDSGTLSHYQLTGNATSGLDPDTGRYTRQIVRSDGKKLNQAVYVISASEKFYLQIDSGGPLYVAETAGQQGGPFNNGSLNAVSVYGGAGLNKNSLPVAVAGIFSTDGKGNINLTQYENSGGAVDQFSDSGTYSVAADGRTPVSLVDGETPICYLAVANGGYCVISGAGGGVIYFEPQTGSGFSNASFSGQFLGGTLPVYVPTVFDQMDTNFSDGNGAFASTYTVSGQSGTQQNQMLTGTYAIDSSGGITISQGGNPIYYGYLVSPGRAYLISLDDNPRTSVEVH